MAKKEIKNKPQINKINNNRFHILNNKNLNSNNHPNIQMMSNESKSKWG